MNGKREWTDWLTGVSYGKRLKRLHAWNAWLLVALTITGLLLLAPPLRAMLGEGRVWLKQLHIGIGIVSILALVAYAPLLPRHWKQLRQKAAQRGNLVLVLALLAGWSVTGVLLWLFRFFPPAWSNAALLLHDAFTWIGVPYAIYHSISRSRWVKARNRLKAAGRSSAAMPPESAASAGDGPADASGASVSSPPEAAAAAGGDPASSRVTDAAIAVIEALRRAPISRATFLRLAAGALLVFGVGPSFYRWLKSVSDTGGAGLDEIAASDGNRMLPEPVPLPQSQPPAGGGGQGQFRIYTVTEIPAFSSDNWTFALSGLVEKQLTWSWTQFLELPRKVQVSDFHCVTGWSVYHVTWEGIMLSELLALAGVKPQAKYVKFYSGDKVYTDALSLEQARMDDVLVAVMMDGKPIPQQLGGPVRLIVPKMYAYKSVKWLQAIELIEKEHIGYWEVRGYDNDAWVNRG